MKKEMENNPEFQEYRRQMHSSLVNPDHDPLEEEEERRRPNAMRIAFGIFMILVYLGMGVLLMINFFGAPDVAIWTICRWVVGVVLVIYGCWRAYRLIAGVDTPL